MLAALLVTALLAPPKFDFFSTGPYDPAVPNPEQSLSYKIGDRHTTFHDQERALFTIANAAGKRVKVVEFGKSWEGRPLRLFVVSSPENIARIERIRDDNFQRALGRNTAMDQPVMVWVNECIHGDETASFESSMPLLYNLAASRDERVNALMKNSVVLINPVYNPDGHERYVVYYNSVAIGSEDPSSFENQQPAIIRGRTNHYRFDMNRDRIAMSQQETRQEVAEFLRWQPQVYIDQHGQVASYFFPPNAMSQNVNVDRERVNRWTTIFGKATGKAFDQRGWTYFVKDTFDLYYPGYLDSFTTLSGAIGMTQETDGGRLLRTRRQDGSVLTLRDGIAHHFTAAMAVIGAAVDNREALMTSYVAYKKKAASGEALGKFKSVVVSANELRPLLRFQDHLARQGINSQLSMSDLQVPAAHDYWSNATGATTVKGPSLIINLNQPQGLLAKAMLEPGSDFEPEFLNAQLAKKKTAPEGETYPGPEGTEFYDLTGWSLPYAYGLRAWWAEAPLIPGAGTAYSEDNSLPAPSSVGYALRYSDEEDAIAAFEALQAGVRGMLTSRSMKIGNRSYPSGTFLFLAARNDEGFEKKLFPLVQKHGGHLSGLASSFPEEDRQGPGSETVSALRQPKLGILFGNGANMAQVGSVWYTVEQVFKLPFTPLSTASLGRNLEDYTCIIVPGGGGASASGKLREYVQNGGALIVLGSPSWALGSGGFVELPPTGSDAQPLPGALFRAQLDQRSFMASGYESTEVAIPVTGNEFYKARKEGGSFLKFADDEKPKLLSGWIWPDESEKALRNVVWGQDVPLGRGHVIFFMDDPTERAMWPGLHKMLLNAILLASSV